jgi:hypothetical protein
VFEGRSPNVQVVIRDIQNKARPLDCGVWQGQKGLLVSVPKFFIHDGGCFLLICGACVFVKRLVFVCVWWVCSLG